MEHDSAASAKILDDLVRAVVSGAGKELSTENAIVHAVFVFGSRAFGTHSISSDYDLYVVVSDDYPGKRRIVTEHMDASLFQESLWRDLIEQNDMAILISFFVPPHCKWRCRKEFPLFLRLYSLEHSAIRHCERNWGKSFRLWKQRDNLIERSRKSRQQPDKADLEEEIRDLDYRARKCMVHSLRFVMFANQLLARGEIFDLREANPLHTEVLGRPDEWTAAQFDTEYRPRKLKLISNLHRAVHNELDAALEEQRRVEAGTAPKSKSRILQFLDLNHNDILKLARWFDVRIRQEGKLFHLSASQTNAELFNLQLISECQGIVLAKVEEHWRIVCPSAQNGLRFFLPAQLQESQATSKAALQPLRCTQLKWERIISIRLLRASDTYSLYRFENEWHVGTKDKPTDATLRSELLDYFTRNRDQLPVGEDQSAHFCYQFERDAKGEFELSGVFDLTEHRYLDQSDVICIANKLKWKCVPVVRFKSEAEAAASLYSMSFLEGKGYLIHILNDDNSAEFIRWLAPQYVAIQNLREPFTVEESDETFDIPRDDEDFDFESQARLCIIQLLLVEHDENLFLAHYPLWKDLYHKTKATYSNWKIALLDGYEQCCSTIPEPLKSVAWRELPQEVVKQFAQDAMKLPKPVASQIIYLRKLIHPKPDRIQSQYIRYLDPKFIEELLFERSNKTLKRC